MRRIIANIGYYLMMVVITFCIMYTVGHLTDDLISWIQSL